MQHRTVFLPESLTCHSLQLSGSHRTITLHRPVDVLGLSGQLVPGQVGSYIQVIDIPEYLGRLEFVLHLLQFSSLYGLLLQLFQSLAYSRLGLLK